MPGKRILLVDYDPRSLSHTREILEGAGFLVSTCGDGLTALDQYKSLTPDLVLLSAMLPKMHGFEVCSTIRKLPGSQQTPLVIITDVYKGKRYRVDAINKYGATEYIEKPIEDANLLDIIKGLVKENGSPATPEPPVIADDRTVQFSRDLLSQMVKEVPTGRSAAPSEKRNVTDKPKPKDDISKKLEESLAGLDLEMGKRAKPKPKPADPGVVKTGSMVGSAGKTDAGTGFTSEDLFTDVIASVERELQSERIIPSPDAPTIPESAGIPAQTRPTQAEIVKSADSIVARAAEMVKPAVPTIEPGKIPEASKKSSGFDSELEKKLSSTLSGLRKDQTAKPSAQSKQPEQRKPLTAVASPSQASAKPQAAAPPVKPETKPGAKASVTTAAPAKEITEQGINFGQYLLLSKIATGGMAELFKAKRKGVEGFEKILAIKRILPHMSDNDEFVTMFIDEAKLAAQLSHHNICQIFDLGKIESSYYIAMEYVHGRDLRAVMKAARAQNRPVPVELAILIASKVASALDYAHRKKGSNGQPLNLVHRDVSPQNVLISYEGEVKLVDFGIAKAATKVHQTQHGALKGKLLYMSPEQAWGRTVDKRSDLFSIGVVLYELLTGRPLFFDENDTEVTILDKVREAKVAPVREYNRKVSADLERIVSKALKKNPDERYQVAFDLQKDLDDLFYTEGYNATGGTIADFIRSLFPEDIGHETVEKESKAPAPAIPVAAAVPISVSAEPARQPEKQQSAAAPAAERKSEKRSIPPLEEKRQEKAVGASVAEAPVPKATAFRDISSPEIIPTEEARKFPMAVVAIIGVVVVGALAFLLFRPSSATNSAANVAPPPSVQKQPAGANPVTPAITTPVQQPTAPAVKPAVVPTEAPAKAEEAKKAEEQKKLADQKAEEEKKKEEDRKKQEQARLDEEEKQAAAQEQAKAAVPPPAPVEETKVAEVQQPPVQQIQQEAPKPEPVVEKPVPKTAEPVRSTVKDGDLVDLTPDVVKPALLTRVNPAYPPAAQANRIQGTVIMSVLVSENGSVGDVKVLRGAGGSSGLNEAAMAAIKKWKFRPAVKEGKRVKVWVTYPIVFKLQ